MESFRQVCPAVPILSYCRLLNFTLCAILQLPSLYGTVVTADGISSGERYTCSYGMRVPPLFVCCTSVLARAYFDPSFKKLWGAAPACRNSCHCMSRRCCKLLGRIKTTPVKLLETAAPAQHDCCERCHGLRCGLGPQLRVSLQKEVPLVSRNVAAKPWAKSPLSITYYEYLAGVHVSASLSTFLFPISC